MKKHVLLVPKGKEERSKKVQCFCLIHQKKEIKLGRLKSGAYKNMYYFGIGGENRDGKEGEGTDDGIALDFEVGDEDVEIINVKSSPCPLLVFSPTTEGSYPVLLFFHGFMLHPDSYKSLLLHISSHRYIVLAPQFSPIHPKAK
ncbi:hypothetical protein HAX54_005736 [Datura stramonium]|uniref:Chlorophyllase n=1 Tax=Datura stramonium TaxID=4076 RepID=A0ABS8RUI9_DATST|nr:hypothetical protein [Datura stramonium]